MKIDNQIINAICEKCGAKPEPGVVLMNAHNFWLCGDCYHDHNIKMGEQYKKEMLAG